MGSLQEGKSKPRCGWGGRTNDRGLRGLSWKQPVQALESDVVRQLLSGASQAGGHTEERWQDAAVGDPDGGRSHCPDGGQTISGAAGGTRVPPRLVWISARQIGARRGRRGAAAMLAPQLGS